MMERIGINAREVEGVREVVFRTSTKELVVQNPSVTELDFQGQKIFQVLGSDIVEREIQAAPGVETKPSIPEEDVHLVSAQANVSAEEARRALEETGGDLAQAILLLTSRRR